MQKPYVYDTLDSKRQQIRLLEVLPDQAAKPVQVIIHTAQLPAVYETISYAWGDPARTAFVTIKTGRLRTQQCRLWVPVNTEAALRRIRLPGRPRTVWIDFLCINQNDLTERSQQVAIMGSIFASSVGNLVYLGELEDAHMAARIQRTIDGLLTHARSMTDDLQTFDSLSETQLVGMQRQALPSTIDYDPVYLVLRLPWFR
ncbi:hypothetical protein LTR17_011582 [Elasticomyces elasticus]|nr:hypothetical protein LTR17_011582 [Elasticomyces elasticus]